MTGTIRPWTAVGLALAIGGGLLAFKAYAVPRYSARYEQKCALCHVNPSGGGLRTAYASQQLVPQEIAWEKAKPGLLERIDPHITKNILVGSDFREFYLGSNAVGGLRNFFQMQGDVYFDFQLDPKLALYYDRGISGSYEMFGLAYPLPTVYVKAGRFVPSYGWKFDDHTMYVRSELGFMPPAHSDVGVEAGLSTGHLDVQLGAVNGARGAIMDNDHRLASAANAMYRLRLGPLGACVGISGYDHPGERNVFASAGTFGYLTWWRLTWLGESDWVRQGQRGTRYAEEFVTSHEFTLLVHQGLELKATYDFLDPDRRRETGARARLGGGVFLMPNAFFACEGLLRRTTYDNGIAFSGPNSYETLLQLHILF